MRTPLGRRKRDPPNREAICVCLSPLPYRHRHPSQWHVAARTSLSATKQSNRALKSSFFSTNTSLANTQIETANRKQHQQHIHHVVITNINFFAKTKTSQHHVKLQYKSSLRGAAGNCIVLSMQCILGQ